MVRVGARTLLTLSIQSTPPLWFYVMLTLCSGAHISPFSRLLISAWNDLEGPDAETRAPFFSQQGRAGSGYFGQGFGARRSKGYRISMTPVTVEEVLPRSTRGKLVHGPWDGLCFCTNCSPIFLTGGTRRCRESASQDRSAKCHCRVSGLLL